MAYKFDDITVYADKFEELIEEYKELYPQNDISKSQHHWTHCLIFLYERLFKPTDKQISHRNSVLNYDNDDEMLYILDLYIKYSLMYGRDVTLYGFNTLTGIDDSTSYCVWNSTGNSNSNMVNEKLSSRRLKITEKINKAHETALRSKLYDSNNITGQLALANYDLGFNMPGVREQRQNIQVLGSDNLPKLEISVKNS